ncbi:ATP-binding cassette domain-containing protein, partial [Klebsiella pneumoniae]
MKRNTVSNLTEKDDFDTLESILSVNIHSLLRPDGGTLLSDVHFSVKAGECLAIIGPNGSGKTSLVRAISQELTHLKGDILLRGRSMSALSRQQRARLVAVLAQNDTP